MYGATINTLNVYTKTVGGDEALQWTKTGSQGNQWKFGSFTFNLDTPFQVVIVYGHRLDSRETLTRRRRFEDDFFKIFSGVLNKNFLFWVEPLGNVGNSH